MTLSGAPTLGRIEPEDYGNEGIFGIPQSSNINGASPSDCLGHQQDTRFAWVCVCVGGSYRSAHLQSAVDQIYLVLCRIKLSYDDRLGFWNTLSSACVWLGNRVNEVVKVVPRTRWGL